VKNNSSTLTFEKFTWEENWDSALPSKCPSSNMIEIIEEVNALEPAMGPMAADPNDLIVRDGPLTQPFMDYVFDTGGIRRT
jgi:hypothetical protein